MLDRPISYVTSADGAPGSFAPPRSTGLVGQTATPLDLGGGRLLVVYRRKDEPGLWAALARARPRRGLRRRFPSLARLGARSHAYSAPPPA
jgi:hypothetical protein